MAALEGLSALDEFLDQRGEASTPPVSPATAKHTVSPAMARRSLPAGPACRAVIEATDVVLKSLANADKRHQAVLGPVLQLIRLGSWGHSGTLDGLDEIETAFVAAVCDSRGGGEAEAKAEFTRLVDGATGKVLKNELADVYGLCDCRVGELYRLLRQRSLFTPRGRPSEVKVMRYLIACAERNKCRKVQESQRQIAVATDIRQPTVSKALQRLEELGWITRPKRRANSEAGWYLLTEPSTLMDVSTCLPASSAGTAVDTSVSALVHRLFGPQGLRGGISETLAELSLPSDCSDKNTSQLMHHSRWDRRVPEPLNRGGLSTMELHRITGTPLPTLRRHLRRLESFAMAVRDTDGLWWRQAFDPDELADSLNIKHSGELKRAQYHRERCAYWEERTKLDHDDRRCVHRVDDGHAVQYVHPRTGQVLWTDTLSERNVEGQTSS